MREQRVYTFDDQGLVLERRGMPEESFFRLSYSPAPGALPDDSGSGRASPGGVLVISPEGKHLGTINTGEATANRAFGGKDGSMLYITADMYLCRIQTLSKGIGF